MHGAIALLKLRASLKDPNWCAESWGDVGGVVGVGRVGDKTKCLTSLSMQWRDRLKWHKTEIIILHMAENCPMKQEPGGASGEVWIPVYMIAPVKKFGRARLSTDFLINKHGGDFMWKRVCADSQTIWLFDVQTSQEGFGRFFTWSLVIKRDHGCKFCSEKRKYYNQRLADSGEDQYLDLTNSSQG